MEQTSSVSEKIEHPDYGALADAFTSDDVEVQDPVGSSSSSSSSPPSPPPSTSLQAPAEAAPAAATPAASPSGAVNALPAEPSSSPPPPAAAPPVAAAPEVQIQTQPQEPPSPAAAGKEEQAVSFDQIRAKALPELEKMYALSADVAEGFVDESLAKVLPQQFARLHFEIQTGIYSAISEQIPAMVQAALEQTKQVETFKQSFFDEWPQLKGKDENLITRTVMTYRQINPQASAEMVIKQAGALAMLQFGLDPIASKTQTQQPAPPPAPPVIHQPAGTTAASVGAPNPQGAGSENTFAKMAEEWREEMFGT